jgi:hypothetical protein
VNYLQANRARLQVMKEYERATREVDFVVGGRPSGRDVSINPITSMTGHPAVSVPTGFNPNGTPASVVLTGRLYEEGRLLLAARAIEASSGIHDRHPALEIDPETPFSADFVTASALFRISKFPKRAFPDRSLD